MTLRQLPEAKTFARPQNFQWDAPADVLARWSEKPLAAGEQQGNVIAIFDIIGEDWWTGGGFTARDMQNALRAIGPTSEVTVQINSPGGDVFEGIAIYNLLRDHKAKVTVEVVGWAASIASIIAMAGDDIRMGLGTFMMVHNAWGVVVGNRHDMREAADLFDGFDAALVDIYEARSKSKRAEIERLMDAESFMGPSEAVAKGFADSVAEDLDAKEADPKNLDTAVFARRRTEAALAKAGVTRGDRTSIINSLSGQRDATRPPAVRDAGIDMAALRQLIDTIKT